jgi:outer membrane protein assembly factor BamA
MMIRLRPYTRSLMVALVVVALPAAVRAEGGGGPGPEESRCVLPGNWGGRIEMILEGPAWRGWESHCAALNRYIRPGRPPWNDATAEQTARLLFDTGYFASSHCSVGAGGVVMNCRVKPARIVHWVAFEGEIPKAVLAEDLRRRVFLRPGTLLLEEERESLERQRRRLEDFLRREGYFGSVVRIRPVETEGARPNQGVRLDAEVRPGRTVTLRNVEIHGDHPLERDEIVKRLTHYWLLWWLPVRFRPLQFEDDLEDITRLLHERGYPEARVTGDWRLDLPNEAVDVILRIDAGPRLVLEFEGNKRLRRRHLAELVTFDEAGIVDPVEMEETAEAIRLRYQEAGHDLCRVTVHHDEPGDGTLRVTYVIEEGPRRHLSRVTFVGNERFSDRVLMDRANLMTRPRGLLGGGQWVDLFAEADRRTLQTFYRERGFSAARISVEKRELSDGTLEARFTIEEGPRREVTDLRIDGLPEEVDLDGLVGRLRLREGAPFVDESLGDDHREILATLAAHGYTRGDVERDMMRPAAGEGGDVIIHYTVHAGPKSRFGGALVRGNFRTSTRLIEEQLRLNAGDDLDLVALGDARRRLRALGPFASVELVPLDAWRGEEETWLLVEVQERDVRTFDGVFAFSTDDRFTVGADYRDRNLFGRAVRLDLRLRLGRVFGDIHPWLRIGNADRFEGHVRAPRPFNVPFDVEASTFYRHEDRPTYREERLGIGAGAVRQLARRSDCRFCPDVIGTLRYEVAAGEVEDRSESALRLLAFDEVAGVGRANVGRIVPGLTLDRRDAFVDPTSGYAGDVRLELASHLLAPIGEGHDFVRLLASGQGFWRVGTPIRRRLRGERFIGGPLVLAGGFTFGGARPHGQSTFIPDAETFHYGGDFSVRGIETRATRLYLPGATFMVVGNLEVRWYLLEGFGFGTVQVAAFADVGTVALGLGELFDETTVSVGPSLRYVTPVGPIALSWGIPVMRPEGLMAVRPDAAPLWGKVHLTFGYPF